MISSGVLGLELILKARIFVVKGIFMASSRTLS